MFQKRDLLTIGAGALLAVSIATFVDGAVIAKRNGLQYNFFMYLPQVLCYCGGALLQLVDLHALTGESGGMFDDDSDEVRSKATFFVSSVAFFAALAVSIWKLVDPYSNSTDAWPGVAILAQVLLLIAASLVLFARKHNSDDDDF